MSLKATVTSTPAAVVFRSKWSSVHWSIVRAHAASWWSVRGGSSITTGGPCAGPPGVPRGGGVSNAMGSSLGAFGICGGSSSGSGVHVERIMKLEMRCAMSIVRSLCLQIQQTRRRRHASGR